MATTQENGYTLEAAASEPTPRPPPIGGYLSDARLGILETRMGAVEVRGVDHETRIRKTEKLGYWMLAVSAAGAMLGGGLTMLVAFLVTQ